MRGWSCNQWYYWKQDNVFPAYAGVILTECMNQQDKSCLSRVCGGDPAISSVVSVGVKSFPRMRGWSRCSRKELVELCVFPAYAGVILIKFKLNGGEEGLSRVCGGDPDRINSLEDRVKSFPRMRGWSYDSQRNGKVYAVFPAYAGVILKRKPRLQLHFCFSRVCGVAPMFDASSISESLFFPRMRGWSSRKDKTQDHDKVFPRMRGNKYKFSR